MSFLTVFFLLITYTSAIMCVPNPPPLTEQVMKDIINTNNNYQIDSYNLKFVKTGLLGVTEHSIVWAGELNGKIPVAVKIVWVQEYSAQEKKAITILNATNPKIEEKGIPRIYYIGPFLRYDAIVMTLFDGDLKNRFQKQKGHINGLSILMIFKRSLEILKYFSECDVVHNDIKPSNIFLRGPDVFISDFDISTIGDEQSKHATQMFASMNFFQNPDAPHRSFKDDLESLVYSMWSIAGIERDLYEGKSGSMDARKPEGFSLFNSLEKEGATAKFVSKCIQLPPALVGVFENVCIKEILSDAKVPRYDRIIQWVSDAIDKANIGDCEAQFEWLAKPERSCVFSRILSCVRN